MSYIVLGVGLNLLFIILMIYGIKKHIKVLKNGAFVFALILLILNVLCICLNIY